MYERLDGKYLSPIFVKKVDEFLDFACSNAELKSSGKLKCPCSKCRNVPFLDVEDIKVHLYNKGFRPNYYRWIFHGEGHEELNNPRFDPTSSLPDSNRIRNMVIDAFGPMGGDDVGEGFHNVEEDPHPKVKAFFYMLKDAEKPLYEGCNMSLLSMAARITNIKSEYNIPHRAIDYFTSLIKDMLPDGNVMTDTSQHTRKLLDGLELPLQKIDVCPNGCMLFWKEHVEMEDMDRLEKNIPEIICKLEKIFPPSFFNVMEHLPVHLPYEAKVGGAVQYRWMYPYERFLYHLKKKVGNKARVESSICNAYLTEEISNFCMHYFESDVDTKGKSLMDKFDIGSSVQLDPKFPELFQVKSGYATYSGDTTFLEEKDYDLAHAYVLGNCGMVSDYERLFEHEIIRAQKRLKVDEVWLKYGHNFRKWFKECAS